MNILLNKWTVTFNNNRSSIYIFLENFFFLEVGNSKVLWKKPSLSFLASSNLHTLWLVLLLRTSTPTVRYFFYYKQTRKCTRENATLNLFFSNRQLIPLTLPSNDMYLQHIKSTCNYLSNLLI